MVQPTILTPNLIEVTEEYIYQSRISGVRRLDIDRRAGTIEIIVPLDKRKLFAQQLAQGQYSDDDLVNNLLSAQLGKLHIHHYGRSNLNKDLLVNWLQNELPINLNLNSHDLTRANFHRLNCFDLQLSQRYQPDEPMRPAITVSVRILDDDSIAKASDVSGSEEIQLAKQFIEQTNLKRNLVMKFLVKIKLPDQLGSRYENEPPRITRMSLDWPIATPHRLVKMQIGNTNSSSPISYDPEAGTIEWADIPLTSRQHSHLGWYTYASDWIRLDISEPAEVHRRLELSGKVVVELDNLLSGLNITYNNPTSAHEIFPKRRTVLVNEFTFNLEEGLGSKVFSPSQLLCFPGVMLDEMRITDILMLLEDKGFEVRNRTTKTLTGENVSRPIARIKQHHIHARRDEGAKEIKLDIVIHGQDANTTRERKIQGEAKYTTALPTGDLTIYIQGQMPGDSKRIVQVVNEIQRQLREQFRHVGSAE